MLQRCLALRSQAFLNSDTPRNAASVSAKLATIKCAILANTSSPYYFSPHILSISAPSYLDQSRIPSDRLEIVLAKANSRRLERLARINPRSVNLALIASTAAVAPQPQAANFVQRPDAPKPDMSVAVTNEAAALFATSFRSSAIEEFRRKRAAASASDSTATSDGYVGAINLAETDVRPASVPSLPAVASALPEKPLATPSHQQHKSSTSVPITAISAPELPPASSTGHQEQPRMLTNFDFPGFDSWFGRAGHAVHFEICSGYGQWIAARAAREPHVNFVACELDLDRAISILGRTIHLSNVRVLHGDVRSHFRYVVPPHSIDCVYVNFPEPALKKRHERWRLVDDKLLVQIREAMVPRADLHMVTDDAQLMDVMVTTARRASALFEPMDAPPAHFVTERRDYGESRYEQIWRKLGKTIHYTHWRAL